MGKDLSSYINMHFEHWWRVVVAASCFKDFVENICISWVEYAYASQNEQPAEVSIEHRQ